MIENWRIMMNQKEIYLGIDKEGNVVETVVVLGELLKEEHYPPHFDLADYHELPKYVTNQDYYE